MTVRQAIKASLGLLTRRDRRLLGASAIIQMATSVLDLTGVLLLGLVAALAVTVVQSQPPPSAVTTVTDFLNLGELSSEQLVVILAASAAAVLLTKSIVSSYLNRRVFIFLANRQALVSARLTKALLSQPLTFIQRRSSQETAYALIQGAGAATMRILGQLVVALSEIALMTVLAIALLLIDPLVTICAIGFFSLVAFVLQRITGGWASRLGTAAAQADISSLNAVQEAVSAYREISVLDRRNLYVDRIQQLRWQAARITADGTFIQMLPKYVFEAALVVGGFALAGALFATQDATTAVGTLALFLAAASRVMPSLLRLQTAALALRNAAGTAGPTFALAEELNHPLSAPESSVHADDMREQVSAGHGDFRGEVELTDVSFTYPGSIDPAVNQVSVRVASGQSLALVGRSGSGKSTLADVILGVLPPSTGAVTLDAMPPGEATRMWPGAVGYVPQEVLLANDTIRNNVALGLPVDAIDDGRVHEALQRAHIDGFVKELEGGIYAQIGERGLRLSGGQRQRLGIARALYTRPKLLVLDEATSALDAETEDAITRTITELEGDVTTVIIAHRLSTVRHADVLVYMESGRAVAIGSFDDVRQTVPALARQAELLGL